MKYCVGMSCSLPDKRKKKKKIERVTLNETKVSAIGLFLKSTQQTHE